MNIDTDTKNSPILYYINPKTGRLIKSTSKNVRNLRKRGTPLEKDKCLYNLNSAKKCLNRLLNYYPNLVHLPSSFIKIPKTYEKGEWRGFIVDEKKILAVVNKWGEIKKCLLDNFDNKRANILKISDPTGYLINIVKNNLIDFPKVTQNELNKIKEQITSDKILSTDSLNIIYNPVHHDFIPILKSNMNKDEQIELLNFLNNLLISKNLQFIDNTSNYIIGVVVLENKLRGIVTYDNKLIKLQGNIEEKLKGLDYSQFLQLKNISLQEFERNAKFPKLKNYNDIIKSLSQLKNTNYNNIFELVWDPLWKASKILIKTYQKQKEQQIQKQQEQIEFKKLEQIESKREQQLQEQKIEPAISLESIMVELEDDKSTDEILTIDTEEMGQEDEKLKLLIDQNDNIIGYF